MTPSSLLSGATPGRFTFAEASTIGRAEEVSNVSVSSETLTRVLAMSRFFAINANGFSLRYFRLRSSRTAEAFLASHARW